MQHIVLRLAAALVALAAASAVLVRPPEAPAQERTVQASTAAAVLRKIERYRAETWRWQALMRKQRTRASRSPYRSPDLEYRLWVLRLWQKRAATARRLAHNPPRRAAWLCIHRHERHPAQGWATNTGNGYYGGLQMDISFQRGYGAELLRRKGTANRWTAVEQIWVAERAYRSGRGFSPWPNSARACGLL